MFSSKNLFFAKSFITLTPSWMLDFSTGTPWSNGTDYNYISLRTAGTYVDSSGYIATSVANIVPRSEEFTNTTIWPASFLTVTANSGTAPDGTNTAFLLTEQVTGNASHTIGNTNISFANQRVTYSCYFKKASSNSRDYAYIGLFYISTSFSDGYVIFNLATGTVETTVTGLWTNVTSSITDVGNGWYRCTATGTPSAGGSTIRMRIGPATQTAISYLVVSGQERSVLAWGAQLVAGSDPLPYSKTTTGANGIPRLTHDKNGSRLGLLVEEQRANLMTRSEDFATTNWGGGNCNVTTDATTAPTNTTVADKVAANTVNTSHWLRRTATSTVTGTTYVFSVFFKAGGGAATHAVLQIETTGTDRSYSAKYDTSTGARTDTDLGNSPVNTDSPTQAEDFGNGWWRAWVRIEHSTGNIGVRAYVGLSNVSTGAALPSFAGAAEDADFIYFWGAQVEASTTMPSSYIGPTITSTATRTADNAYILDSKITSWQDPGALVIHFYPPGQAGTLISSDDGANTQLGIQANTTTQARAFWSDGNTLSGTIGTSGVQKAVHYWNGTNSSFCINGGTVENSTNNITTFSLLDFLTLGSEATDSSGIPGSYSQYSNIIVRKVEWYAGTFSNTQLKKMTQ